jgi:hypothetical protein
MSSLQKEPKIYGAVESQSYITFTGFCKRIYDTAQQSVDVFVDDAKIDTIQANQKIADIENKYEVFDTNGFCFTYELPKEYIGQKHKLEFKTQDGEQLLHSPTHTIDKFSPLYNQAMFIESLHQPIQYHALENGYTKNALSFIVIEENLSDEAFIEFVLEMCKKHKELSLTLFYFNEHQKNQATKQFKQIKNKQFINPSNVEEIIKSSEIYLHNVIEEFRFTINEEYYNKVKNQSAIKENLFVLELTRKAKKKKDMAEMAIDTITPILFETSIVSQIFEEDERYNEFIFMNSLGQVDETKIKDSYCPNCIGFLATKKNLDDEEFMNYIKELMKKFPKIEFKGFYFNAPQRLIESIEIIKINQYTDLIGKISVLIINPQVNFNWLDQYTNHHQNKIQNILVSPFERMHFHKKIQDIYMPILIEKIKNNLENFHLTFEDIKDISYNHILMSRRSFEKLVPLEHIEKEKLLNMSLKELACLYISEALKNQKFIEIQKKLLKQYK